MIQSTSQPTWKRWGGGEVVCCQYNKKKKILLDVILHKEKSYIQTKSREAWIYVTIQIKALEP